MVRTEISLFLKNVPGELGRMAALFAEAGINIDAMTIQDASSYVQELFKARGKSLKRDGFGRQLQLHAQGLGTSSPWCGCCTATTAPSIKAMDLLSSNTTILFDIMPVIAIAAGASEPAWRAWREIANRSSGRRASTSTMFTARFPVAGR
jgi:hypothetical protein